MPAPKGGLPALNGAGVESIEKCQDSGLLIVDLCTLLYGAYNSGPRGGVFVTARHRQWPIGSALSGLYERPAICA